MNFNSVRRHSRRIFLCVLFVTLSLAPASGWHGQGSRFETIFAVGDSLTDTGNLSAILGQIDGQVLDLAGQPLGVVLRARRLSNGPLTVERIAANLEFPDGANASAAGGNNFAIAGALANPAFQPFAPFSLPGTDLLAQTQNLIATKGSSLDEKSLVVVFIGSNDLFSAVRSTAAPPGLIDAPLALVQSAANVAAAIKLLSAAGAENFLVFNAPNIARTPALIAQVQSGQAPPTTLTVARTFTLAFNSALLAKIIALKTDPNFDANVWYFSTFATAEFIASPLGARATGLQSTTPCAPELGFGQPCSSAAFWDFVHVTTKVHDIFADAAQILLRLPPLVRR